MRWLHIGVIVGAALVFPRGAFANLALYEFSGRVNAIADTAAGYSGTDDFVLGDTLSIRVVWDTQSPDLAPQLSTAGTYLGATIGFSLADFQLNSLNAHININDEHPYPVLLQQE